MSEQTKILQAFPSNGFGGGMTLRDWFAGQALAGLLSNCDQDGISTWQATDAACVSYQIADAMLTARAAQ